MSLPIGVLFNEPYYKPLDFYGKIMPNATLQFLRSGSAGPTQAPAAIYQDAGLTTPYVGSIATADANGRFSPIYLSPDVAYRAKLFDQNGRAMGDHDPIIGQPPAFTKTTVKAAASVQTANTNPMTFFDPDLQVAVPVPGVYRFDFMLGFQIANVAVNPGLKFGVAFSGAFGLSSRYGGIGNTLGTNNFSDNCFAFPVLQSNGFFAFSGVVLTAIPLQSPNADLFWCRGYLAALTPGTILLPWSQNSVTAQLSLLAGSSLVVRQVK